jgi:hypothetical protein
MKAALCTMLYNLIQQWGCPRLQDGYSIGGKGGMAVADGNGGVALVLISYVLQEASSGLLVRRVQLVLSHYISDDVVQSRLTDVKPTICHLYCSRV